MSGVEIVKLYRPEQEFVVYLTLIASTRQAHQMDCDILAGERGPSYTEASQIKDWKVLHIRFTGFIELNNTVPRSDARIERENHIPQSAPCSPSKSVDIRKSITKYAPMPSQIPASMPLSAMLKLGKAYNTEN
ncbi:hypothetical protein OS493_024759 [Desmophyllum pertusum]|uniref:Uncharacterized protein n=1 Tax=Desmophyllum pertusum TaxID=174260 RepID=A0A9W9ZAV1_9CNID|nr:hypothetical protein OS493_024759 [Desmophyllum pertusum]